MSDINIYFLSYNKLMFLGLMKLGKWLRYQTIISSKIYLSQSIIALIFYKHLKENHVNPKSFSLFA